MTVRIIEGDCLTSLRELPGESVQCCVTSPPYWGLRDYGHAEQLGLEKTPKEYIDKLVSVFREVRRVLSDDGTLWLNLGDCYATGGGKVGNCPGGGRQGERWVGDRGGHSGKHTYVNARVGSNRAQRGEGNGGVPFGPMTQPNRLPIPGLKPKDLVGIPWRVALALQEDGWYLRSDIIWHKPNPMPESVTDRPTRSHEYLFLLTKSERYYYDADAIREPLSPERESSRKANRNGVGGRARSGNKERKARADHGGLGNSGSNQAFGVPWQDDGTGRNKRTVWTVSVQPFSGAHFATFPPKLIEPCILAGCAGGGTVLDPFGGAGTTGLVASRLGRNAILCELNSDYAEMARARIERDSPLFAEVTA